MLDSLDSRAFQACRRIEIIGINLYWVNRKCLQMNEKVAVTLCSFAARCGSLQHVKLDVRVFGFVHSGVYTFTPFTGSLYFSGLDSFDIHVSERPLIIGPSFYQVLKRVKNYASSKATKEPVRRDSQG